MSQSESWNLPQIAEFINAHFDLSEISDLCFKLGIDYENLPGSGKKANQLVLYCGRRQQLNNLVGQLEESRPFFKRAEFLTGFDPRNEKSTPDLEELASTARKDALLGRYYDALQKYKKIQSIAPFYPGLDKQIHDVKQALAQQEGVRRAGKIGAWIFGAGVWFRKLPAVSQVTLVVAIIGLIGAIIGLIGTLSSAAIPSLIAHMLTPKPTPTPIQTSTPILTLTSTPTSTLTPTSTQTNTSTPTPTFTPTPSITPTPTPTPWPLTIPDTFTDGVCLINASFAQDATKPDAVMISANIPPDGSFCGWYILLDSYDASDKTDLTFWVRGANGGENFEAGIKDTISAPGTEVKILHEATGDWRQISIPLSRFFGQDFSTLENVSIGFNVVYGSGTIYVADFMFEGP